MYPIQYILVVENDAAKKFITEMLHEMLRRRKALGAVYDLNEKYSNHPQFTFKMIYATNEYGMRHFEEALQSRPNKDEILSGISVNRSLPGLVGRLLPETKCAIEPETVPV